MPSSSSLVVILIAGVAMSTRRYSERHFNATALLRCLGCQQAEILRLYSVQFLLLLRIEYHPTYQLWLALPLIGTLFVGVTGYWGVRSVVKQPPLVVLRKA